MKAKFMTCHFLPMDKHLTKLHNVAFQEVLAFARFKTRNPKIQSLTKCPGLEALSDALLLVRSGALVVTYTDSLPDGMGDEGIVLKLNMRAT